MLLNAPTKRQKCFNPPEIAILAEDEISYPQ